MAMERVKAAPLDVRLTIARTLQSNGHSQRHVAELTGLSRDTIENIWSRVRSQNGGAVPRANNFLLGNGERLTSRVHVPSGGGEKNPPYTFERAQRRLSSKLSDMVVELDAIPNEAAPKDEVVAIVTLHPRYIAKSDFPQELLSAVGLRPIGSRSRTIVPESWGIKKTPEKGRYRTALCRWKEEHVQEMGR